jgi:hypothetical protein
MRRRSLREVPPEVLERQRARRRTAAVVAVGLIVLAALGAFYFLQVLRLREIERTLGTVPIEAPTPQASSPEADSSRLFVMGVAVLAVASAGGVLLLGGVAWARQFFERRSAISLLLLERVDPDQLSQISLSTLAQLQLRDRLIDALLAKEPRRPPSSPPTWLSEPPFWWQYPPPWWPESRR